MNLAIYSDTKNINTLFASLKKGYTLNFFPLEQLKKDFKAIEPDTLVYIDVSSLDEANRDKTVKLCRKLGNCRVGIIDSKGTVPDIAELFHGGIADYIGKAVYQDGVSAKRLKSILDFKQLEIDEKSVSAARSDYILSNIGWNNIKPGNEYTFCFMFIELDNQKEIKSIYGGQNFDHFQERFHNLLETLLLPVDGKIWMWMDFGGLALIPFDGKTCDAVLNSFRMILNRRLYLAEFMETNIDISFRIALHIGNTEFKKRGDTGKIVSDTINSIFHLGQKFARPGDYCITSEVFPFIPPGLGKCFLSAGEFEGREIMRMRLPL